MAQVESNTSNLLLPPSGIPARLIFPEGDEPRARKVVRRSNHGHVFKFPSRKCQRIIELESRLEYDRAILLELDPDVIRFAEQPFQIEYADEGVIKSMFPDLLVYRRDGSKTIEEVKPAEIAAQQDFKRRVAIERAILAKHGYRLQVMTEEGIRSEPRLSNAKKLLPYRRVEISLFQSEQVKEALDQQAKTGHDLVCGIPGITPECLFAMVSRGVISTDLTGSLTMSNFYLLP